MGANEIPPTSAYGRSQAAHLHPRYERDPSSIAHIVCRRGAIDNRLLVPLSDAEYYRISDCGKLSAAEVLEKITSEMNLVVVDSGEAHYKNAHGGDAMYLRMTCSDPDEPRRDSCARRGAVPDQIIEGEEVFVPAEDPEKMFEIPKTSPLSPFCKDSAKLAADSVFTLPKYERDEASIAHVISRGSGSIPDSIVEGEDITDHKLIKWRDHLYTGSSGTLAYSFNQNPCGEIGLEVEKTKSKCPHCKDGIVHLFVSSRSCDRCGGTGLI